MDDLTIKTTIPNTRIIVATYENVAAIAPLVESYGANEGANLEGLRGALSVSQEAWIVEVGGRPAMVLGIISPSLVSDEGSAWMVKLSGFTIGAARRIPELLQLLFAKYAQVHGYVEVAYGASSRLVEWLGGEFTREVELDGKRYRQFVLRRA